jgi:hypothetical protein
VLRPSAVVVVLGLAFAGPSARAADDPVAAQCVSDAALGQKARDEGHLLDGRAAFVRCGDRACPSVVQRECVRWLAEIEERIPTLVASARDGKGADLVDAEITLDGRPFPQSRLGREVQVDPGPHELAARRGSLRTRETVVVREREKGRAVALVLASPPEKVERRAQPAPGVPVASFVLLGVAAVGGAGFAYFWARGMDKVSALRGSCAPFCTSAQIDEARTPLTVARISLGIGVAALVGALVVYLVQPTPPAPETRAGFAF